ncbi:hypothetical protein FSARC_7443 [Fusarium sarcochroum]|uniref:Uncharacterized protein n=1 Tax=Fusarium sarcochroum TaxID=1208366 RepID=A0A8H4TV98_9HYPO|nr:hypothetical protein FSARC_7443 [Fusarium sarcochroum]
MAQPHPLYMGDSPPLGPLQPPIPHMDPERVYAKDQPPNLREAFTEFYPNGLPNVYKMLQTPGVEGVPQTYVEDYLPIGFYTNPQLNARAIFSTQNGLRPFRHMQHLLPQRRVHLWTKDEIQSVCNSLRNLYWDHMKGMQQPYCWDSLWTYFDACDIYNYGALNLWNVVNQLFDENKMIYLDLTKEVAIEIGHWADEWVTNENNCTKLLQWDEAQGPFLPLLTEADWKHIGNIQDEAMPLIASALKHRRTLLLSPEKLRPSAKPNHLVTSCANNSLENWLAGQRIFTPAGLPSPPEARSHYCSPTSKNASAPVTVHLGNHYYDPPSGKRVPSAVEALHQSAAAAGPASQAIALKQPETDNTLALETLRASPKIRSKSTEPFPTQSLPSFNPTNDEVSETVTLSCAQVNSAQPRSSEDHEYEQFDALTPTKIGRRGRDNPRVTQGASKSTVTASLPGSAVMGFSELAATSGHAGEDPQQASHATQPSPSSLQAEDQGCRSGKNKGAEPRMSTNKELKKGQRPNRALARSGPHDPKGTQFPSNANVLARSQRLDPSFHTNPVASGVPEEIMVPQPNEMQTPLGISFHSNGAFNHVAQGGYPTLQQNYGVPAGLGYRHSSVQQPTLPQKGLAPNRGRNASVSSRFDRFEPNDGRWAHQHHHENFNGPTPTSNRGGYQRGGPRKGGPRRGTHNQRNATAPIMQPQAGPDFAHKKRDGPPWKGEWRRPGSDLIQVTCQNVQNGLKINDYVPCSCQMCDARNRSVYIAVEGYQNIPSADLQSRIKFGLAERYGFVEEVYPLPSKEPGRFIARFVHISSVGDALRIGGGNMPEQGISLTFSPAMRSKWTLPNQTYVREATSQGIEPAPSAAPFSPYPFGPSMPINTPNPAIAVHIPPGVNHPAAVALPLEYGGQIWPKNEAQRGLSGMMQPPFFDQPPAVTQPARDPQQGFSEEPGPTYAQAGLPVPNTVDSNKDDASPDELLQTKPPAEEALNEIHDAEQDDFTSPPNDGNKIAGAKARVSLPNSPPKASQDLQEPSTTPTVNDDAPAAVKNTTALGETLERGLENQAGPSVAPRTHITATSESSESKMSHARVPSTFTEHEIKERRQAWAKISMPLNPHRPKPSTPVKPSSGDNKDNETFRVLKSDRREANAMGSEESTSTQTMILTPETASVYEPSPEKSEDEISSQHEEGNLPLSHSIQETEEDTISSEKVDHDEAQPPEITTGSSVIKELKDEGGQPGLNQGSELNGSGHMNKPSQDSLSRTATGMNVFKPHGEDILAESSHSNHQREIPSDTLPRGKAKKPKSKSKKKRTKPAFGPQGNAAGSSANHQTQVSPGPLFNHPLPQTVHAGPGGMNFEPTSTFESQDSGSSSPTKRHHEEPGQRSTSGPFKRSKKHGHAQGSLQPEAKIQASLDESDSPDEDSRGRRGFRMGRGGSLRMGKQRRPRPLMTGPALAEQHMDTQVPLPSSDFAFECSGLPIPGGSPSLHGPETGSRSRLNPKAQEFVSPSRLACFNTHTPTELSGTEAPGNTTFDISAIPYSNGKENVQEPSKLECDNLEPFPCNDSVPSVAAGLIPKHRRALSEGLKKSSPGKGDAPQGELKKTPGKNQKRGKGKERAVTSSAKLEKVEGKRETAQDTPHTPEHRVTKMKKPGMINDDWPSLPGPRDRAPSKPQTPSIWGAKTKSKGNDYDPGQDSPLTKE